jgi:hypothetical protein
MSDKTHTLVVDDGDLLDTTEARKFVVEVALLGTNAETEDTEHVARGWRLRRCSGQSLLVPVTGGRAYSGSMRRTAGRAPASRRAASAVAVPVPVGTGRARRTRPTRRQRGARRLGSRCHRGVVAVRVGVGGSSVSVLSEN